MKLITDKCLYSSDNIYTELTCTSTSAKLSWYKSNNCNPSTLINTTTITEGSYTFDSETVGCIDVDGCNDNGGGGSDKNNTSNKSDTKLTIGIGIGVVLIVIFLIIITLIIFIKKRKLQQIAHIKLEENDNDNDNDINIPQINDEFLESGNNINNIKILSVDDTVFDTTNEPYRQFDDNQSNK